MFSFEKINKSGFLLDKNNIFNINENHLNEAREILSNNDIKCHYLEKKPMENIKIIYDPIKFSYLENTLKKIIHSLKNENKVKLESIWVQKTTENSYHFDPTKLPFIPHIDKKRMFKIMVYLNEVNINDGPIHFIESSGNEFENLRLNLKDDYKKTGGNLIRNFQKSDYISCYGPIGTAIFFDTNCPHYAGKIENNGHRMIYRFNFDYNI